LDRGSTSLGDRSRDPASMLEVFIRRVDNGIHFLNCDVALDDFNGLA
jgi:hypothetical protein